MINAEFLYVMLVLPTLFGLTLMGEGVYKISHYQEGWINVVLGVIFLAGVAFGYFYLVGYVK
ncbi:hypothetical protein A2634_01955 [Candidatus Amesbacteria bacterium RIFCSPHIGHO2_01_FULL_48_32]|uniref:Uncharacterized protein n=1 Tax=Candidatus Amesbacteria bacterium RIFCSPLOWO2_01_FULL_48_25 TaxID=1797259 RepID=A0A1F4ZFY2_9BACT|nr:MAG: hypothetical protein A2634_01955 [Candidatus Amesbacteria bacterium RIFCSPHIGHO2_01_FULL_48_32]OGD04354.1 MAG: hypothetical protein A2989_04955 [Candidatus Amesbacteria bacterium RIFCSPLOWO2_01_FULL_48_25]HJZ06189.1 hypothetical protein [Patescibacteria group bacterium]